ncbi:hypothetical protein [Pseudomonas putida]|uniref:Uncharacterized protein n=1 Tax=Pseudomonas putida TaxID=303 RepID=A0A6I7ESD1_PSEPU|nr:hypothetical protein [Pseudomonas putida]QHW08387.1 hypothetical protein C2H86_28480 [Pseudomonas putida]
MDCVLLLGGGYFRVRWYMQLPQNTVLAKAQATETLPVRRAPSVDKAPQVEVLESDRMPENSELSSLSRQLSAAAQRAAIRDSQLSRSELSALAARLLEKLTGASYSFNKLSYDNFLPDTDDRELLARAQQATDFANGRGPNPFTGLSSEQLSLITYDEGGDFTVNERRAARLELAGRRSEWSVYITRKMEGERQRTGGIEQGIREIIEYYRALPAMEEAQILGNWEMDYRMMLSRYREEGEAFDMSLIDLIAKQWKTEETSSSMPFDPTSDATGKGGNKG